MTDLAAFARLIERDSGLCVVSTLRADQTIHSSVVNAGVLDHPTTGAPVVGLVAMGGSRKLAHLRARPRATVVARAGWEWVAVEGPTELVGLDDPLPGLDAGPRRARGGRGQISAWGGRTASARPGTPARRSGTRSRTACGPTSTARRSTRRTSRRCSTW